MLKKVLPLVWVCAMECMTIRAQSVSYRMVEPVFLAKCAPCHRQGDAAPFPLTCYGDIYKRTTFIRKVVSEGYMPPWKADAHYREYANDRRLTAAEKKLILQWIDKGAPAGDSGDGNTDGGLLAVTAWHRRPDLYLRVDSAFTVKGDNAERFVVFKVPYSFTGARPVEAIEFVTNDKKIVHHTNYGFYAVADSTLDIARPPYLIRADEDDRRRPDPYGPLKRNMTYYTGWIPGAGVESYPGGFGWVLPQRGILLITVHYVATPLDVQSTVGVNLFFGKDTIERPVRLISLGSGGVAENDISPPFFLPRNKVSSFHLQVRTQDEQSLLGVWPHMHLLGKEFYAYAVTPAGDTINLVHIPAWDFRWQELYRFKSLIRVPKGSVINMDCTYDNTVNNPFNPNSPPKGVFSSGDMRSTDEMMTLLLLYVPYKEGDERIVL